MSFLQAEAWSYLCAVMLILITLIRLTLSLYATSEQGFPCSTKQAPCRKVQEEDHKEHLRRHYELRYGFLAVEFCKFLVSGALLWSLAYPGPSDIWTLFIALGFILVIGDSYTLLAHKRQHGYEPLSHRLQSILLVIAAACRIDPSKFLDPIIFLPLSCMAIVIACLLCAYQIIVMQQRLRR